MKYLTAFFLFLCLASGPPEAKAIETHSLPSWFYEPGSIEAPGALGFANPSLKGEEHSRWLAKCRAVEGLCALQGWRCRLSCKDNISPKELKKQVEKVVRTHGLKFHTTTMSLSSYGSTPIYVAHAYQGESRRFTFVEDCPLCSPEDCRPSYLCNPAVERYAGSVGCAERAIRFMEQYRLAVRRAIELFAYLHQVDIDVHEFRKLIKTNLTSFKLRLREAKLTPTGNITALRFMVRSLCLRDERLYVYLISPDMPQAALDYDTPCWVNDPECLGGYVAVGSARPNINGYYAQVKQAIFRALIELAKSKEMQVSEETVKRSFSNSFVRFKIVARNVRTGVRQTVSARLVGIYQKGNTVYAGVMEVKR
jgi:hypothetical protein